MLAWWCFTGTFVVLRLLTFAIHKHVAGLGNVSAGGIHLHHYVWGILLLTLVAVMGLTDRSPRESEWMGAALGVGLALVVDEVALLVELKDVYWDSAGAASVAAGVVLIGVVGSALALTRPGPSG